MKCGDAVNVNKALNWLNGKLRHMTDLDWQREESQRRFLSGNIGVNLVLNME